MKKYSYCFGVLVLASILLAAAAIAAPRDYVHWWKGYAKWWWTDLVVISLLINPLPLARGASGTLTLTIGPPQSSDTVVPLTTDYPALAQVPISVTVPASQTKTTVSVNGREVGNATITATLNGATVQSTVQVQCPSPRATVDWDPVSGAKVTLTTLQSTQRPQQGISLCWAASAEMAMSLWPAAPHPSQCQQVIDAYHPAGCSCPPPPPGTWVSPACDTTGDPLSEPSYGFSFSLGSVYYPLPGPAFKPTTQLLSKWKDITDQICDQGSPILYSYQIPGGSQHMWVIYGYEEDGGVQKVLYIDPQNVDPVTGLGGSGSWRFDGVFIPHAEASQYAIDCAVAAAFPWLGSTCYQFPVLEYYAIRH